MFEITTEMYMWIKAIHLIGAMSWMAGLLYLPRLFVYHANSQLRSEQSEIFKVMEKRLLYFIMVPAAAVTLLFGGLLLLNMPFYVWNEWWVWIKLLSILGLMFSHLLMYLHYKKFANETNQHSVKYYRILNEVPTVLMITIIIMAVVRPFEQ